MAAKFKKAIGIETLLVPDGRGIFDVTLDGELVYSKFLTGTFPDDDHLVEIAREKHEAQGR